MVSATLRSLSLVTIASFALLLGPGACAVPADGSVGDGPGDGPIAESDEVVGAPEEGLGESPDALTGSVAVGTQLVTTANLNLRSGPSTSYAIIDVMPYGDTVTVKQASPENGFYKVSHGGSTGWAYGYYLKTAGSSGGGGGGGITSDGRDAAIKRARSSVGFSYWWGHGRFRPEGPTASTKGSCSGDCPNCDHGGSYGGDCSGLVAKVWQVPGSNSDLTVDSHPYSTWDFDQDSSMWTTIGRNRLRRADAMVYNTSGHGHIFLYDAGDAWGWMHTYECKGCSYGCLYNSRTASQAYHAIRRKGY